MFTIRGRPSGYRSPGSKLLAKRVLWRTTPGLKVYGPSSRTTPCSWPKIALAVYIENGYYGARYAGHIASLLIEKYLKGEISRKDLEKRMLEKTLDHEYAKPYSGEDFKINEYVW